MWVCHGEAPDEVLRVYCNCEVHNSKYMGDTVMGQRVEFATRSLFSYVQESIKWGQCPNCKKVHWTFTRHVGRKLSVEDLELEAQGAKP